MVLPKLPLLKMCKL